MSCLTSTYCDPSSDAVYRRPHGGFDIRRLEDAWLAFVPLPHQYTAAWCLPRIMYRVPKTQRAASLIESLIHYSI
jgi:hypothetical protein